MKSITTADLRKKTGEEQAKLVAHTQAELRSWRFGASGGRSKNVRIARTLKRTIARLKTIANEK